MNFALRLLVSLLFGGALSLAILDLSIRGGIRDAFLFSASFAGFIYHFFTLYTSARTRDERVPQTSDSRSQRWVRLRTQTGWVLAILGGLWMWAFDKFVHSDLQAFVGFPFLAAGLHFIFSRRCPRCGTINETSTEQCKRCKYLLRNDLQNRSQNADI
jgi:hypothetical protein